MENDLSIFSGAGGERTALLALAERCERAGADEQGTLLVDAYELISRMGRPDYAWAARFMRFIDAKAFLDAAMTLVPDGWRWMTGQREYPHARAYVENGELFFSGVGTRRNPRKQWFEVTAATPALALVAAALKAHAALSREVQP